MDTLLEAAVPALRPWLDVPFAFLGHSMGALVAFELARSLRDERFGAPVRLFASGRRAPHLPPRHPPISHLPDDDFVDEVDRRYGGIPDEVRRHRELLELLVPGLKADLALLEAYDHRPGRRLTCPVSCFGGKEDAETTPGELAAWREQTEGAVSVRLFPGGHFFVQATAAQVIRAVAEDLGMDGERRTC